MAATKITDSKIAEFTGHRNVSYCVIDDDTIVLYDYKMKLFMVFIVEKDGKMVLRNNPMHVNMERRKITFGAKLMCDEDSDDDSDDTDDDTSDDEEYYQYAIPVVDDDDENPEYEIYIRIDGVKYHLFDYRECKEKQYTNSNIYKYATNCITELTKWSLSL